MPSLTSVILIVALFPEGLLIVTIVPRGKDIENTIVPASNPFNTVGSFFIL